MRVALYGGSFDPVHLGHLWAAQGCAEAVGLDEVIFLPAATSPLKRHGPTADNAQRLMMLRLALSRSTDPRKTPVFTIDTRELDRGGVSYTIDTVAEFLHERPDDELFLMIGSDAFAQIRQWHRPAELLSRIMPLVFRRGGDPEIDWSVLDGLVAPQRIDAIRSRSVELPMIEVSSSEIRARIASGRPIRYRVPHAIEAFIAAENLYRDVGPEYSSAATR